MSLKFVFNIFQWISEPRIYYVEKKKKETYTIFAIKFRGPYDKKKKKSSRSTKSLQNILYIITSSENNLTRWMRITMLLLYTYIFLGRIQSKCISIIILYTNVSQKKSVCFFRYQILIIIIILYYPVPTVFWAFVILIRISFNGVSQ